VASSATAILIGHVAGQTSSIRVGSGGIMLPNHAPLIVAEQFGTLETIYPGRIDLGLGRAPGTDQLTALALRRNRMETVNDFPNDVLELKKFFSAENKTGRVRAIPGEGLDIPIWILGSSTDSARLAAMLGLPYAFASHFAPTYLHPALRIYREQFQPSEQLQSPYVMVCVNAIVAGTIQEAAFLSTSFLQLASGIIKGKSRPLPPPVSSMEGLWSDMEKAAVSQMMHYSFIGDIQTVKNDLEEFLEQTGANELMVTSHVYDQEARRKTYTLLKEAQR
jgi:luciferase family oxidoreductase group 1